MCSLRRSSVAVIRATLLVCIAALWSQAESANILGLFPSRSPSHLIIHMSVVRALAERGHNLTIVAGYEPLIKHENIRPIVIPPMAEKEKALSTAIAKLATKKNNFASIAWDMYGLMSGIQKDVLQDERFTALYASPDTKFDLVIMGWFVNDFLLGVAGYFKCPVIMSWMGQPMEVSDFYMGNPIEMAFVPNMHLHMMVGERMGFVHRLKNFFISYAMRAVRNAHDIYMNKLYSELFPQKNFPTYAEMQKNVSLVFCNHHFSEGPIRTNVPAMIEIGGIQTNDTPDPLPAEIESFLNASQPNGAILFSLGSNLQGADIRIETVNIIFKTLASLKQNVIWKWENLDNTPGKSENIIYKKWLPQDDILAHRNLRLFITHAGKGGLVEAQFHGVPMVALPVFADQHGNAAKMVAAGYGVKLDILQLTEENFKNAINEVLTDHTYTQRVKKFSQLYRDRPLTAKQSVVYWTEYVIRHHGAAHMQSPLVHMNAIESYNFDVVALICLALYAVWRLLRLVWGKLFKKKSPQHGHKKAKKQ